MSFKATALFALTLVSAVFAAPTSGPHEDIVPVSVCKTITKGTLQTSSASDAAPLSFVNDELSVGGSALQVEFQSCQPNWGGYSGPAYGGHIYIPSSGQCLGATAAQNGPPFTFTQAPCEQSDDSSQNPQQFVQEADGTIYYAGATKSDGSYIFFGSECPEGKYGIDSTQTTGPAELQCMSAANTAGLFVNTDTTDGGLWGWLGK